MPLTAHFFMSVKSLSLLTPAVKYRNHTRLHHIAAATERRTEPMTKFLFRSLHFVQPDSNAEIMPTQGTFR